MYFLQQILNGICQGSIYALIAVGYTLIVGIVGLITFVYGETLMVGAMSVLFLYEVFKLNIVTAAIVGFISSAIVGVFVHKLCYSRFMNAPRYISLLCTIGCSILIKNLAQIYCGVEQKKMPSIIKVKSFNINGLYITNTQLIIIATVIVASIGLTLFLYKTKIGLRLRAVSQDKTASRLVGINVERDTLIGNCIGTGLGGIAGVLIALYLNTTSATMGTMIGFKALIFCVLGGLQSIVGAAVGGLVVGLVENIGIMFLSTTYRDLFSFVFLVLALMIKPEGLFVRKVKR